MEQVFIIFVLNNVCIAFLPQVRRRRVPVNSSASALFTPRPTINSRNCSSVFFYLSLFSLSGKILLLRCKYRYRYRLYLNKKQRKPSDCSLVLFLVSSVW